MQSLCWKDAYAKEFDATVVAVDGPYVVLDQTGFYAEAGGQPADSGTIVSEEGDEYTVVHVKLLPDKISHQVDREGLTVGDKVHGVIDWEKRHRVMRHHTASHILSGVVNKETGAMITGKQISGDENKSRIDFSLEEFDKSKLKEYEDKANEIVKQKVPVTIEFLTPEEAEKEPQLTRLAKGVMEGEKEIRLIIIGEFDRQACGGTHVQNTEEIGKIEIYKAENKGKNNRRAYFKLHD